MQTCIAYMTERSKGYSGGTAVDGEGLCVQWDCIVLLIPSF